MSKGRKIRDLTGQTFDRLTVIEQDLQLSYEKIHWRCQCVCGNTKSILSSRLIRKETRSCGCWQIEVRFKRSADKAGNWRGGRHRTIHGYIVIKVPEGHFNNGHRGYAKEHRIVMEQKLGRCLTKDENVHHINGVKDDNRIENLELWTKSQPSGQRVEDKIKWAKEILAMYKDIA